MNEQEAQLASSSLARTASRLRKRYGTEGFALLLSCMESDWTNHKIALAFGLRPWQVKIWREVITYPSQKLVPEMRPSAAKSPITLLYQRGPQDTDFHSEAETRADTK